MSAELYASPTFLADFDRHYRYYAEAGGTQLADRFHDAVNRTLTLLEQHPLAGRERFRGHPRLHGYRSFPARRPFNCIGIFYRVDGQVLTLKRLVHGTQDLASAL